MVEQPHTEEELFSKDPKLIDQQRMQQDIAKNIVSSGASTKCLIQLAYVSFQTIINIH